MSQFSNQIQNAFEQIHNFMGDSFTYRNTAYVGIFGPVEIVAPLSIGGFTEGSSLACVTRKAMYSTPPKARDSLNYNGRTYQILNIQDDRQGVHFIFALREL